jgi:hypothetical protein
MNQTSQASRDKDMGQKLSTQQFSISFYKKRSGNIVIPNSLNNCMPDASSLKMDVNIEYTKYKKRFLV